jgi:hypothetical protein
MNKRDVLEVAVKIMGLYALCSFFGSIVFVGGALSSAGSKFIENRTVYVLFSCLATVLYLVFAVAFLSRGRRIAEILTRDSDAAHPGERAVLPPHAHLYFWIRILGLYFFVAVSSELVSAIAQAGVTIRSAFWWTRLVGETLQLGLSLAFIFRSGRVARFVEEHAEPITEANAS